MRYQKFLDKLDVNLENKTFIVTGANAGLGFETTKYLLHFNARVIMACRNLEKANKAIDDIRKEITTGEIVLFKYDQSNYSLIKDFAKNVKASYQHIDGIIFNAGVYFPKVDAKTTDGLELTVGTNYLGQFMLFEEIKDIISEDTRIVLVTSLTAYLSKNGKLSNIDKMSRNKRYGFSKLLLARESYELTQLGYKCVLVHPGICSTNILFNKDTGLPNLFSKLGRRFLNVFTHPASKAALSIFMGVVCDYEPLLYIKPRGLFAISGYPKIKKYPRKYSSSGLLDETREYLAQKVGNYASGK